MSNCKLSPKLMINAPRRENVFVKKFNNISLGSVTLRRSYLIVLRHSVSADVRSIVNASL